MRVKIFAIMITLTVVIVSCSNDADDNGPTGPANTAPELAEIADQTVNSGETENAELSATDVDGDSLSFSISTNPGFLSITGYSQVGDTASATLVMAPDESIYGTFIAIVQVSDGRGGTDSTSFIIEVQQLSANTAPELAEIADQTVNAGETENAELSATDVDGDSLSFSISTNPGFLSITGYSQVGDTASATLVMAPDESIYGTFIAIVQVSDGRGGTDSTSFIIEVQQLPKIEWGYHSLYVSMTFRYSGGVLCGYTAYPHFRSIGGSGTVEFEAGTTSGSVLVEQFNVLGGGQYYSLVIKGGLKEDPYPLPGETLIVESPSADTDYEDTVHYVRDMTITSMELELRP